ncbi:MAG: prenyltransferase/squalene oxidase repeat-containing protein [Saprospiraceae bacterium]
MKITPEKVDKIISKSIANIKSNFRTIGNKSGWHQHLGSNKVGNTATAQAIIILNTQKEDFNDKHKAVELLKNNQFKGGTEDLNGGWGYVSNLSDIPTTESTAWVLQALFFETSKGDIVIKDGLNWLINNHIGGDQDIGWGSTKNDVSRVYSTCLAIQTLRIFDKTEIKEFNQSINWLKKSQNTDFGWGDQFGHPSTITHTSHALITLIDSGVNISSQIIQKGAEWLIQAFEEDKFWINVDNGGLLEFMDIVVNEKPHRISYYHFSTPYAIIALIKSGKIHLPVVFKGINYLVDSNDYGNWEHPFLRNQRIHPIWAIYDSLYAFKTFKNFTNNWENVKSISLKGKEVRTIYTGGENIVSEFFKKYSKNKIVWSLLVLIPISLVLKQFGGIDFIENQPTIVYIILPFILSIIANLITNE